MVFFLALIISACWLAGPPRTGVEQRGAVDQLRDVLAEPVGLEDLDVRPERQHLNRRAFEGVEAERRLEPPMLVRPARHVPREGAGGVRAAQPSAGLRVRCAPLRVVVARAAAHPGATG